MQVAVARTRGKRILQNAQKLKSPQRQQRGIYIGNPQNSGSEPELLPARRTGFNHRQPQRNDCRLQKNSGQLRKSNPFAQNKIKRENLYRKLIDGTCLRNLQNRQTRFQRHRKIQGLFDVLKS